MLLRLLASTLFTGSLAAACTNCTNSSPEPITLSPAPWTLHGDVYGLFLLPGLGIPLVGNHLPVKAFGPLERKYPESIAGKFIGKLGMIQVIRYTDSPVGPYDEMLIIPGFFEFEEEGKRREAVRVSRIYVSQKFTAWNGRKNWNIPKHLARFDWTFSPSGAATVKIYPYDTDPLDPFETLPSLQPFFQMTFSPIPPQNLLSSTLNNLLPGPNIPSTLALPLNLASPFTTDLYSLLGIDATLYQPPVPFLNDSYEAITSGAGEKTGWKKVVPGQFTKKASLGFVEMDQSGGEGEREGVNGVGDEFYRNFWPGLKRVNLGVRFEDARITFGEGVELGEISLLK